MMGRFGPKWKSRVKAQTGRGHSCGSGGGRGAGRGGAHAGAHILPPGTAIIPFEIDKENEAGMKECYPDEPNPLRFMVMIEAPGGQGRRSARIES